MREVGVRQARKLVGDDQFLHQPENHQPDAKQLLSGIRCAPMIQVPKEVVRAHDRAGHQLREKRYVQRVVDDVGNRLLLAAIHVDHVRHALEGVEADAHRQNDGERPSIGRLAN